MIKFMIKNCRKLENCCCNAITCFYPNAYFHINSTVSSQVIVLQRKPQNYYFPGIFSFLRVESYHSKMNCYVVCYAHLQFTSLNQLLYFGYQKTALGAKKNQNGGILNWNLPMQISYRLPPFRSLKTDNVLSQRRLLYSPHNNGGVPVTSYFRDRF